MIDPLGAFITECRAAGLADKRVRGGRPAAGDSKGTGSYQRFIILSRLAAPRLHRTPLQTVRLAAKCYGATEQDAAALYGELSDFCDNAGPRLSGAGVAIYNSLDETGGTLEYDPDTQQPFEVGILELIAATQAVAP